MAEKPDRNLALDLVRVTEVAAIAAAHYQGRGDKEAVDQAAVDAMRQVLSTIDIDGVVVIGEGEKDEAPMLFNGEAVGNGNPPKVDVAVDPVDGTRLTALGMPGALAVIALAPRAEPRVAFLLEERADLSQMPVKAVRLQFELPADPPLRLNRPDGQLHERAGYQRRAVADVEVVLQVRIWAIDDANVSIGGPGGPPARDG